MELKQKNNFCTNEVLRMLSAIWQLFPWSTIKKYSTLRGWFLTATPLTSLKWKGVHRLSLGLDLLKKIYADHQSILVQAQLNPSKIILDERSLDFNYCRLLINANWIASWYRLMSHVSRVVERIFIYFTWLTPVFLYQHCDYIKNSGGFWAFDKHI